MELWGGLEFPLLGKCAIIKARREVNTMPFPRFTVSARVLLGCRSPLPNALPHAGRGRGVSSGYRGYYLLAHWKVSLLEGTGMPCM